MKSLNIFRYFIVFSFVSNHAPALVAGGAQSAQKQHEDEQRIQYLSEDLKEEYRNFMRNFNRTRKYKEQLVVTVLTLNRHLRKANQEALAQHVETLMSEKYGIEFERFQGCRDGALLDAFYPRRIQSYPPEQQEERTKQFIIRALKDGADVNTQREYLLTREEFDPHATGYPFIKFTRNALGETALMYAAYYGFLDTVKYLLSVGADINMQDDEGRSAYDFAQPQETDSEETKKNKLIIQKLIDPISVGISKGLVEHGTRMPQDLINIMYSYSVETPAQNSQKTPKNATDEDEKKENEIINNAQFELPQPTTVPTKPQLTELQQQRIDAEILAAIKRRETREDEITLLLKRGAHINAQDIMGHTPLMLAITLNKPDIFKVLLEHIRKLPSPQEQFRMQDNAGNTALKLAKQFKREAMIAELLRAGAEEN